MSKPIAYTYDADVHCEDCAEQAFGLNDAGDIDGTDSEGNLIGVIAPWDEWYNIGEGDQTLVCGDCGAFLADYEDDGTNRTNDAFDEEGCIISRPEDFN